MATSETDSSDGGDSPALGLNWQVSRWGREDQRGNGNLMNAAKVLEASRLIKTGEIVWSDVLPAGGQATPTVYEQNGKEYVVIMAGGHHFMMTPAGDSLIAYALPDTK